MQFTLKLDVAGNADTDLPHVMTELVGDIQPAITWRQTDEESGNGWPVVEFTGDYVSLITVAVRYSNQELGDAIELIKTMKPFLPLKQGQATDSNIWVDPDLSDDYVATEGAALRKGQPGYHL